MSRAASVRRAIGPDAFSLDPLLPTQTRSLPLLRLATPSARLMNAVLEQAADDVMKLAHAAPREREKYLDALRWTTDVDTSHPFSFVNLCEALGYSATALRTRLLAAYVPVAPARRRTAK